MSKRNRKYDQLADIEFKVDGRPVEFSILHNCPAMRGLDIQSAFDNWVYRTAEFTAESLCRYIRSKEFNAKPV